MMDSMFVKPNFYNNTVNGTYPPKTLYIFYVWISLNLYVYLEYLIRQMVRGELQSRIKIHHEYLGLFLYTHGGSLLI